MTLHLNLRGVVDVDADDVIRHEGEWRTVTATEAASDSHHWRLWLARDGRPDQLVILPRCGRVTLR